MFIEEEDLVVEQPENVGEQTTEESVEGATGTAEEEIPVKTYTEEEFNKKLEEELNNKLDEVLPKKLARIKAKTRRELEEEYAPYKEVETVLKAGMGSSDISEAARDLREYYQRKGVQIPAYQNQQAVYNDADMKVLADNEVRQIIDLGLDEVTDELNRLSAKGIEHMTPREKLIFPQLAEYRKAEGSRKELLSIGVKNDVIDSSEFKEFASQFNPNTPVTKIYELYAKTTDKPPIEKIGSLKNGNSQEEKQFYTPEEVDKLTDKELDDPKVFERVRKSMLSW